MNKEERRQRAEKFRQEREKEIAKAVALHSMPAFGLEPTETNLPRYYQLIREVLA